MLDRFSPVLYSSRIGPLRLQGTSRKTVAILFTECGVDISLQSLMIHKSTVIMNVKQGLSLLYRQETIPYSVGYILTQEGFLCQASAWWLHCISIDAMSKYSHYAGNTENASKTVLGECDCYRLLDCALYLRKEDVNWYCPSTFCFDNMHSYINTVNSRLTDTSPR